MNKSQRWISGLRWLGVAATAGFLLSAFTPLWNIAGARLAVESDVRPADAIVVLGSGVMPDGTLMDESMRRFVYGVRLYKRGLAPLFIVSGPPRFEHPELAEAIVRKGIAIEMGIPADNIIAISDVMTTREESMRVAAAMAVRHASTILLVTESLHMRRAKGVFDRAGLKTLPAPSDSIFYAAVSPRDRLFLMWRVLEQGTGLAYYRLAGYV